MHSPSLYAEVTTEIFFITVDLALLIRRSWTLATRSAQGHGLPHRNSSDVMGASMVDAPELCTPRLSPPL
jgi:hypothetical protein